MQPILPIANIRSYVPKTSRKIILKNHLSKTFLTLIILGFALASAAQNASQYSFATSGTASLAAEKNGNTVDMTAGTTQLVAAGSDDVASSSTAIGFSFTFYGTAYTTFTASSNGGIRLGGAISTTTIGTSFPVSGQPILAPYLGDIRTSTTGKIHYKLLGSYPNRTLVIEFLNMGINFNNTTANGTFQVRLYEQTNVIEYVYGAMAVGSISTSSSNAADARTVVIGFSNTTGANNQFSVNQTTYATSVTATAIQNTNAATGNITGLNSAANGSRRSFSFTPTLAYKSQFISMNTGSATWCAGETRAITVTIKNIGTATWSDGSPDVNIGVKWNTNAPNWTDYHIRTDAGGLAPGATQTYTFNITASNNAGGGYTTPLAAGTNNLTFDIVKEADCWLGDNIGSCGPGNIRFTSANQTINAQPAITPGSNPAVCQGTTSANLSYTGAIGTPNQYSIDYDAAANAAGFTDVTNAALPATPVVLSIPAGAAIATYNAILTVTNTSTGCVSNNLPFTVTVNAIPAATAGTGPTVCRGVTTATLSYSGVSGSPNQYSIDYSAAANTAGFTDISNAALTASPLSLTIPAGASPAAYTATLTVRNSASGCAGSPSSFTITVIAPIVSITGPSTICQGNTTTLSPTTGGTWVSNSAAATVDNSGLVTGVSGGTATFTFTETATGCSNTTAAVTVNANSTINLTSAAATAAQTVCQNSAITNITYGIGGGGTGATVNGLPTGVTGNYNSGTKVFTISGTPSVAGSFSYTVTTAGPCVNPSVAGTITVTATSTIALSSAAATSSQTVCINNAITNITYTTGGTATGAAITAGALPAGVTGSFDGINSFTITGTPSVSGAFSYTVSSTGPCPVSLTGTITVNANSTLGFTSAAGTNAQTKCINNAITNITYLVGGGGTGAGVTGLPTGVSGAYNSGTKVFTISGTPTVSGTFNYLVTTTGPCINASLGGTITVVPDATISLTSGAGSNTQALCQGIAISNITYAIGGSGNGAAASGLPAGVTGSYSGSIFTISGTPTVAGTFSYTVTTTGPCVNPSLTGTITTANTPSAVSATPASSTICTGSNVPLTAAATVISTAAVSSENFNGTPAYTSAGTVTGGNSQVWTKETSGTNVNTVATFTSPTGGGIMIAVGGAQCGFSSCTSSASTTLTSPAINTNNYSALSLAYSHTYKQANVSGSGTVEISTNGTTWTVLKTFNTNQGGSTAFVSDNITLANTYLNQSALRIRFNFVSSGSSGLLGNHSAWWAIDDVVLNGVPLPLFAWTANTAAAVNGLPANAGTFLASNRNITVTPTATTTYTLTAKDAVTSCGANAATATSTVTVNQNSTIALTSGALTAAQTVCINNAITDITYSIGGGGTGATATGLPSGITGAYNSGVYTLSGTPTQSGTFNYIVTTTGPCINPSLSGTITVNANSTIALSSANGSNSQTVCINNALTNITYAIGGGGNGASVTAGALPAGINGAYNAGVYTISGTPTQSGTFNYTVTTTGPCVNNSLSGTISVTANGTISLASAAGTDAQTICINNAITDITYVAGGSATSISITSGILPAGVNASFSGNTFTIAGTPTQSGIFNYTVTTAGPCMNVTLNGTITVNANSTIALSSANGSDGQTLCINTALNNISYAIGGGGNGASITAGALPAGLSSAYNAGVYTISGTPTESGTFNYTVTTTGPCVNNSLSGTIVVNSNAAISLASAAGTDAQTICINNAITDITYVAGGSATGISITSGILPAGVTGSFSEGSFSITGTPTESGTFNYTVTTTGPCVNATLNGTITVNANSTIVLSSANGSDGQTLCINTALNSISYAIGGGGNGASITAGALPAGLSGAYNAGVYTISGTPTESGSFSYTVTTTGPCVNNSLSGTITVNPNAALSLTSAGGTDAQTICINNAITGITYLTGGSATGASITSGALPTGVTGSFSEGSFIITGIPTESGTFNYTVTTTGPCVNTTLNGTIIINANSTIALSSANGSDGQTICINTALNNISYAIGGGGNGASITAGALPAGLSGAYNAGVYTISGTPTESGSFSYTLTTNGPCINNSLSGTINVTANGTISLASAAGTDAQTVCINTAITSIDYLVSGTSTGASITSGSLPAGVTGSFSGNIFTISGTPAESGTFNYTVSASGSACENPALSGTLVISPVPVVGSIAGPDASCAYTGLSGLVATYTVSTTDPSSSFNWTIPAGSTGVNGQGTNSISFRYPNGFSAGSVGVTVTGTCGLPESRTLAVTGTTPATPVAIAGEKNVCPYVGTSTQITYSIAPVANAITYHWVLPPSVNLVSASADSTSISVSFAATFGTSPNKQIRVRAISGCGNSAERVIYLVAQFATTPAAITGITNICPYVGAGIPVTYIIPKVTAATSYIWSVQAGTTDVTHPNGAGENDTVIVVTYHSDFSTSAITVRSANDCGTSSARSLTILKNAPSTPGLISGPTNACEYIQPNPGFATYSIRQMPSVISYNWTVPAGAVVTHQNQPGVNDTLITVSFAGGFTTGAITVTATNGCGTSASPRQLAVGKLGPATPGVIDVIQTITCPNRQYSYTIAAMPANATSVHWTIPAAGTLLSGQGTTSITVSYPATAVAGSVTAQSFNNCGNSVVRQSTVKLPACPAGFQGRMSVPAITESVKPAAEEMQLSVFPNPTVSDFNLKVITAGKEEIRVRILDIQGREMKTLTIAPYQTIGLGVSLKAGTYIIEVTQGQARKTTRVLKF